MSADPRRKPRACIKCLPVAVYDGSLQVALADPLNPTPADEIGFVIARRSSSVVADPAEIAKADRAVLRQDSTIDSVADILKELGADKEIAREAAEAADDGAAADLRRWPTKRRSSGSSTWCLAGGAGPRERHSFRAV